MNNIYQKKYLKYKSKYLELKKQLGGNLLNDFFIKYPFEKEKISENIIKIKFDELFFDVYIDGDLKIINITNDVDDMLTCYYLDNCTSSLYIENFKNTKGLLDVVLKILNIPFSFSNKKICDECIEFNNQYIYLNKEHELYSSMNKILSLDFDISVGLSKDLLTEKLYSINFIWLRTVSFTEKCFSIMGSDDIYTNISSIENILKLQENDFFNKLINWSKNNANALVNFWIDNTQVKIETLINLRLVFDVLNRHLGLNLCIRDIWSLKITREMNDKYPGILPKATGHSLIMRVDLYKCIIGIEELERHTYSVFADLDMKQIGQDIILSEQNISILNRIGLVLTKLNYDVMFENGFQILGSTNYKIRTVVIETFKLMLIERTMIICTKIKRINQYSVQQLVYHLYQPMYNCLYFKCGYGILYDTLDKPIKINNDEYIENYINKLFFDESLSYTDNNLYYVSFDLFDNPATINDTFLDVYENYAEFIKTIKDNINKDKLCDYLKTLRYGFMKTYGNPENWKVIKECLSEDFNYDLFSEICQVKEDDLIIFDDPTTLPPTKHEWPFHMYKKYYNKIS